MKYANIANILGWAEEPATVAEGIFLQPEEAASVETALVTAATANAALLTAEEINTTLTEQVNELTIAATVAADTIAGNDITIAALQAQVAKFGKESSGAGGSTLPTAADETTVEPVAGKLPRFDSPDHPANQAAAKIGRLVKK